MKTILFIFLSLYSVVTSAQTLSGTFVDKNDKNPVPNASVTLLDTAGKRVLLSNTDNKGKFVFNGTTTGRFVLNCNFVGYQVFTRNITLTKGKSDLGTLLLIPDAKQLKEVTVSGQTLALRLQPDKKIFEVGKDVLSQNGSVSDALNGIPSVMVSPQGEVSLRGNAGVTVLINGRRSGLTQGSALEQLQADQVDRIEVITNPSARYDAAGNAGVINIVLKKNKKAGFNGQVKVVAGTPNDTRLNPSLNYKSDKFNFFSTFGMRKSDYLGLYTTNQVSGATSLNVLQNENRHDDGKMLYLGADYLISPKHTMTAAFLWNGTHDHDKTELNYDYRSTAPDSSLRRNGESWERRNYHQLEYNYTQLFTNPKQKWTVDVQYDWWDSNKDWALGTQMLFPKTTSFPGILTNNRNTNRDLTVQSDWIQPIGKASVLELGIKTENRRVQYDFLAQQQKDGNYDTYMDLDNGLDYSEHIHGGYAQLSSKKGKFSYLGGLRMEITSIRTTGRNEPYNNHKDYTRLFPTLHLDYALTTASTLQAHYSRRINRPSLSQLSPYTELTDLNAQDMGNPNLNPAYTNMYELGFFYRKNTLTINPSVYTQFTKAPLVNYIFRNAEAIFITMPVNIATEYRQGFELNVVYNPLSVLQLSTDLNIYRFQQSGVYSDLNYNFSAGSSSGRLSAMWKLTKSMSIQGRYYYNGPSATAQSRTLAVHWADFGVSKSLLSDKLAIVADVTNIFDSRRYRTKTTGTDYTFSTMSRFNGARYRLSVVYKLKQNAATREAKTGNRN